MHANKLESCLELLFPEAPPRHRSPNCASLILKEQWPVTITWQPEMDRSQVSWMLEILPEEQMAISPSGGPLLGSLSSVRKLGQVQSLTHSVNRQCPRAAAGAQSARRSVYYYCPCYCCCWQFSAGVLSSFPGSAGLANWTAALVINSVPSHMAILMPHHNE